MKKKEYSNSIYATLTSCLCELHGVLFLWITSKLPVFPSKIIVSSHGALVFVVLKM